MRLEWPTPIVVGDRVHCGITSPDTGVVLAITKNGRRAKVQWDHNGVRWRSMDELFCVTRSLTEWVSYRRGEKPCPMCGYPLWPDGSCHLCDVHPVGSKGSSSPEGEEQVMAKKKSKRDYRLFAVESFVTEEGPAEKNYDPQRVKGASRGFVSYDGVVVDEMSDVEFFYSEKEAVSFIKREFGKPSSAKQKKAKDWAPNRFDEAEPTIVEFVPKKR